MLCIARTLQKLLPAKFISESLIINHIIPQVHGARVCIKREVDGQIGRVFVRRGAPGAHHRAEARGRVSAPGRRELGRMGSCVNSSFICHFSRHHQLMLVGAFVNPPCRLGFSSWMPWKRTTSRRSPILRWSAGIPRPRCGGWWRPPRRACGTLPPRDHGWCR